MAILQYKTVLVSGFPFRESLTIPTIYMGAAPLPLKRGELIDAISRNNIVGIEQGGIKLHQQTTGSTTKRSSNNPGLKRSRNRSRQNSKRKSISNGANIRLSSTNRKTKVRKQKRIGGKFAK